MWLFLQTWGSQSPPALVSSLAVLGCCISSEFTESSAHTANISVGSFHPTPSKQRGSNSDAASQPTNTEIWPRSDQHNSSSRAGHPFKRLCGEISCWFQGRYPQWPRFYVIFSCSYACRVILLFSQYIQQYACREHGNSNLVRDRKVKSYFHRSFWSFLTF